VRSRVSASDGPEWAEESSDAAAGVHGLRGISSRGTRDRVRNNGIDLQADRGCPAKRQCSAVEREGCRRYGAHAGPPDQRHVGAILGQASSPTGRIIATRRGMHRPHLTYLCALALIPYLLYNTHAALCLILFAWQYLLGTDEKKHRVTDRAQH
jgi:hypothetical protein